MLNLITMNEYSMNEHFFVAVDGGATGTRLRAYLPNKQLIGEGTAGPSSITLGVEAAWDNIQCAIKDAVLDTPFAGKTPSKILAGLAGSRNPKQQQAFFQHVQTEIGLDQCSIDIVSDAYTSALGALGDKTGIVVAIGTGVAACAIGQDRHPRYISGWGFKVGDEGAGSWIGLQAVQAYLKYVDGRENYQTQVYNIIADELGTTAAAIQDWCLRAQATEFARFAKPIALLAEDNDALALDLMKKAGYEIVEVIQAYDNIDERNTIVLLGGLGKVMQDYLPADICARLQQPKGNSLDGAGMLLFDDSLVALDKN